MSRHDPFADVERLLIDGNNLLHRLAGGVEGPAVRMVTSQLRARLPAVVQTLVMLDGHPAPSSGRVEKLGPSLEVRHAGGSADDALLALVLASDQLARARILVVTDDHALAGRLRRAGARTRRLDWLAALLQRPARAAAALGQPRAPRRARPPNEIADDVDVMRSWRPGRGATVKKGNPRRGASSGRRGR